MEKNIIDKKLFFKLVNLLEAHNMFFWLDFGTLLGAYRDKEFVKGDDDVDLSLWVEDYWKIRQILDLSDWKYKAIWRREISIYHESNPNFHIDLFFYDKTPGYAFAYVYLLNKTTQYTNIESKMVIPGHLLKNFKTCYFYNHPFNIPKKTDEYLTEHYGNWKNKDNKWYYSKRTNIDRNHALIGIIIPTFLRDDKMQKCVESILKTFNNCNRFQPYFKIYIGDQGDSTSTKKEFYAYLEDLGHKICILPYNCGLSFARNFLISQTQEPYILVLDDDYEFTSETKLEPMLNLLLLNKYIGIVGGKLNDRETAPTRIYIDRAKNGSNYLTYISKPIAYYESPKTEKQESFHYYKTEIIPNFFMAKRELFEDIKWDEELKLIEHSDFFLRLKTTNWKILFTPDTLIEHHPENNSDVYNSFRNLKEGVNCTSSLYKMRQKYNLTNINKFIEPIIVENNYLKTSKLKIVQLARIPCANSGLELSNLINKYSKISRSRYILGMEYGGKLSNIPYRKFPMDLYWQTQKEECLAILREADIVHVHHDIINEPEVITILKNKKVIWTLYNLSQSLQYENNDFNNKYINKCKSLSDVITVADQSLQRKMFSDITSIRVPLVKMLFNENITKSNLKPVIVFAPTNQTTSGIATKKYHAVLNIIQELKNEGYDFEFDLIEGIPYEQNLIRKNKADILIDDVDPDYEKFHNSSIEAVCFGAIALTNYSGEDYPFYKTDINNLKNTLIKFITNPTLLKEEQNKVIVWKNEYYQPDKLLKVYEQLYTDLIHGKYFLKEQFILSTPPIIEKSKAESSPIISLQPLPTYNLSKENIISSIINFLNQNRINFCLSGDSCLEAVMKKAITSELFHFSVSSIVEKNLILNQFQQYNNILDIKVDNKLKTKTGTLYGLSINVPFPVVKYLEKIYNKTWEQLKNE